MVSLFEYLVLDKVRVVVKDIDYAQYIWESVAGGSLAVKKDTKMVHGEVSGYKVSGVSDCFFCPRGLQSRVLDKRHRTA